MQPPEFAQRWRQRAPTVSERVGYQDHWRDLCQLVTLPTPSAAGLGQDDIFERHVAVPAMNGRTLRRVITALPVVAVPDAVLMYISAVKEQKQQRHADSHHLALPDVERAAAETFLPAELQPVVAAAVAAQVSPTTAVKAVVK